jgi:hypothetical protein
VELHVETIDVTRDPGLTRAIGLMLREITQTSTDPIAKEIAQEVLGGRLRMSEILSYGAYRDALGAHVDEVVQRWDALSGNEFEQRLAEGREYLAGLRAEAEQEKLS